MITIKLHVAKAWFDLAVDGRVMYQGLTVGEWLPMPSRGFDREQWVTIEFNGQGNFSDNMFAQ